MKAFTAAATDLTPVASGQRLSPQRFAQLIGSERKAYLRVWDVAADINQDLSLHTTTPDVEHVTRIGGGDRYRTAELIAGEVVRKLGPDASRKAVVSTGAKFPDALAAAPLSASCGWPLYLVGRDGLSAATRSAMATQGVHGALVLGSDRSIAASVERALATDYGETNVRRVQGETRYGTAAAIATYAAEGHGLGWDGLALAKGTDFPDALVGGVLQCRRASVILLTPSAALATETAACLAALPAPVTHVTYLGDERSIQPAVREQVESLLRP
jgi:putative cell wall-binding protein